MTKRLLLPTKWLLIAILFGPIVGLGVLFLVGSNTCLLVNDEVQDAEDALIRAFEAVKRSPWGPKFNYTTLEELKRNNSLCCEVSIGTASPGPGWIVYLSLPKIKPYKVYHVKLTRCGVAVEINVESIN